MRENKFHVPRCGTDTKVSTFHLAERCLVGDLMQEMVQKLKRLILPTSSAEPDKLALIYISGL